MDCHRRAGERAALAALETHCRVTYHTGLAFTDELRRGVRTAGLDGVGQPRTHVQEIGDATMFVNEGRAVPVVAEDALHGTRTPVG